MTNNRKCSIIGLSKEKRRIRNESNVSEYVNRYKNYKSRKRHNSADKIFNDIIKTIEKTDANNLDYRMEELYAALEDLDLEYYLNNFPIEVEGEG